MAFAVRMAQTTWGGPLASGTGTVRMSRGAAGELAVTWAARTERANGKTSPEELAAAAHSACYAANSYSGTSTVSTVPLRTFSRESKLTVVSVMPPALAARPGGGGGKGPWFPAAGRVLMVSRARGEPREEA